MRLLRTNTAVIVTVGPFYDKTDGVTIKTALTITNERITLTADTDAGSAPTNILDNVTGATSGTANDLNYITGNDAGMMQMELAAADVNRLGRMFLSITDAANHCPVFHEFMVLPAAIYDWLVLGTVVPLPANVTQFGGSNLTSASGIPEVKVASIAANAITATAINADAITAAKVADGTIDAATFAAGAIDAAAIAANAIGASELAADAVTEIVTGVLTTAMTESYNTDGAAPTVAQALFSLIAFLFEANISSTTLTAKKLDGSTSAMTFTLSDATNPVTITRAT